MLAADLTKVFLDRKIWKIQCMIGMGLCASVILTYLAQASSQRSTLPMAASFIGISFPIPGSSVSPEQIRAKWAEHKDLATGMVWKSQVTKQSRDGFSADARGSSEWLRVQHMRTEVLREWNS